MSEPKIRPYRPTDTRRLLAIWEAASRRGHPFLSEAFIEEERERVRDEYLPMAETWVAVEGGRPVGFLALVEGMIGGLFVDPEYHRRGIGRALAVFAVKLRPDLELEVFEENTRAIAFYEAMGFRATGSYLHEPSGHRMLKMRN